MIFEKEQNIKDRDKYSKAIFKRLSEYVTHRLRKNYKVTSI